MEVYFQLSFLEFVDDVQDSRSDFQHLENEANPEKAAEQSDLKYQ